MGTDLINDHFRIRFVPLHRCSAVTSVPLLLCTHCPSVPTVPLWPLSLFTHCSSVPIVRLFFCTLRSSIPVVPPSLCAQCSCLLAVPLYPLILCTLVPLFLYTRCSPSLCSSWPRSGYRFSVPRVRHVLSLCTYYLLYQAISCWCLIISEPGTWETTLVLA